MFAAWEFASEGKRTLIFSTQANWVESYGKQVVDLCAGQGCYVVLDLHWSDAGEWGKQIGQHVMPDQNSMEFWKSCASTYKNHPAIIFDLYNEPHDVSWDVWSNGGQVTEKASRGNPQKTYQAVGMQAR